MPVETHSIRDRSAVGRFPSVTLALGEENAEENAEEKEELDENDTKKENACRRRLRKACSCCCRQSNYDDMTETIITGTDEFDKEEVINNEKPVTNSSELTEIFLKVKSIDLVKSKSEENRQKHHTDLYQSNNFIIRRGQKFLMWITLSRPFNTKTDQLHLELKTGSLPVVSKRTHVIVPLVDKLEENAWGSRIIEQESTKMKLMVNSPASAVIGRHQLTVETNCASGRSVSEYNPANDVYILFNPWCEDDVVFLHSEEERQEYVLNDVGIIYYGTMNQIGERTWDYGQFDEGILAACLFILEKSGTPSSGWGDPVNVVRVVSAMVNSVDDRGVIQGNWSGDYSGGNYPTMWSGSVEILKEYHKNKGTPVKYGQCWVFAGVVTTALRSLGIPTRSVTNFSSAHDTDVSLTTDVYLDNNLEPIEHLNSDSIWNFHVWNDCWMARPDLPAGHGGWQAVDATPQETSQGTFRCGPASLSAVRNGQVYMKHDTPFVFAEVNSDKIYWKRNEDGTFTKIYDEKKIVGHFISTKAVGTDSREDITNLYKHPEGSEQERIAVETACSYGTKAEAYSAPTAEDVSIHVTMEKEGPRMGADAELTITLQNSSSENRKVTLHSQVAVMYYTGVHKATVKKDTTDIDLLPNEEKSLNWTLLYNDYKNQLIDQAALMLTLTGRVAETQQVLATQFNFRLRTPDLIIEPIGKATVGQKLAVKIAFTNPLPQVLKAVIFHVEGLGLLAPRKINYGDIGSHASVSITAHFVPTLSGKKKLLASLDCKQLTQVHGVSNITVYNKNTAAI